VYIRIYLPIGGKKGEKYMKRKLLKTMMVMALLVPCMVIMAACGGFGAGFSNQNRLARAWVDTFAAMEVVAPQWALVYGQGPSFQDLTAFTYDAQFYGSILGLVGDAYDGYMKSTREVHDAKMSGKYNTFNAETGAATAAMDAAALAKYREDFNNTRATVRSIKMINTTANPTAKAVTSGTGADPAAQLLLAGAVAEVTGLATHVEVWNISFEWTPHTGAQVKGTVEQETVQVVMVRIGGKWFLHQESPIGGGGNGNGG